MPEILKLQQFHFLKIKWGNFLILTTYNFIADPLKILVMQLLPGAHRRLHY